MSEYLILTSLENCSFLIIALLISGLCLSTRKIIKSKIKIRFCYTLCISLAILSACILVSQYRYANFQLKTGLSLFAGLFMLIMMCIDSTEKGHHYENIWRSRLVGVLSSVFSFVIITKSLIWHSSIEKLQQTLSSNNQQCLEMSSDSFG